MRLLATLTHGDVPVTGPRLHRHAVRALAWRGRELLFVRCADGDLKLPGGGVHGGEPDEEALRRELAAETGASVLDVTGPYGAVWLDVDVALDRLRSARTRRPPPRARELLVLEQLAAGR